MGSRIGRRILAAVLASSSALALTAAAGAATATPSDRSGSHKVGHDRRMPTGGKHTSLGSASLVAQQAVNSPGSDTTSNDTQVAPSLAAIGNSVAAAWNDSANQANDQLTGYGYSDNNGLSFADQGSLPKSASGDYGDPRLAADPSIDTVYLTTTGETSPSDLWVYKSTDRGQTYAATPVEAAPQLGSGNVEDRPDVAVDTSTGAGQHNVYVCWTGSNTGTGSQSILFNRSTDGAATFVSGGGSQVSFGGNGCEVVVGPDHAVYVFYYRGTDPQGEGGDNKLFVRKSTDQGATFGAEVTVADLLTTTPDGSLGLTGGKASNSFPSAAVSSVNGRLYVAYNDDPADADDADVYYVTSTNGSTWSAPAQANNDDAGREQYQPSIAISTTGNQVMLGYYSTVNDATQVAFHRRGRLGSVGTSGALVLRPSFQLGPDTPDVAGQDGAFPTRGGRDAIVATPGYFDSAWSDNRAGDAFYTHQPDIQFARVAAVASSAQPAVSLTAPASVTQGDNFTIRATVTNSGAARATDLFVSLVLPAGVVARSVVANGGGRCYTYGALLGCYLGSLASGSTRLIDATVLATATGARATKATLTTSSADTNVADNVATASTTVNAASGSTGRLYSTGDVAIPLPDQGTIRVPLDVPDDGGILSLYARLRLDHTFDSDVDAYLTSPSGTVIELTTDNGADGANYGSGPNSCAGTKTVFIDTATTSIIAGSAPFAGNYKPEQPLGTLAGENPQGRWTLTLTDDAAQDTGTLGCFQLGIFTN